MTPRPAGWCEPRPRPGRAWPCPSSGPLSVWATLGVGHLHEALADGGPASPSQLPAQGPVPCPPTPSVPQCRGLKHPTQFEQLQPLPGLGGVHGGTGGLGASWDPGVRSPGAGRRGEAGGTVPHAQKVGEALGWESRLAESQSLAVPSDRSLRSRRGDRQLSG